MKGTIAPTAAVAALLASAALLSACGGGADFASRADGICTEQAIRVNAVLSDGGTPTNGSEAAAQASQLLPIERPAVAELGAIAAPREVAGAYRAFLAGRKRALILTERQGRAAARGAAVEYAAIGARCDRVLRNADANAGRAGLDACAERLPEDAVAAVEGAIRHGATGSDPALCSQSFTANFVRSQFGGLAGCRRRQRDPAAAADAVRISGVRGIGGVYALAVIVPQGGSSGGQRLRVSMLYEDGAYRTDSIGPAGG